MKKFLSVILFLSVLLSLTACTGAKSDNKDIVILFTNDVHGALCDNIGYSGLAAYKKSVLKRTPNVVTVDCGDALQGTYQTAISSGELAVEAMNIVGYDYAVFGNHEFDYGMERLFELVQKSNAQYLCCNVTYSGSGKTPLEYAKPYAIRDFGYAKVGFVGVSTPESKQSSSPVYFQENGKSVYDFCGDSGDALYSTIQKNVDACRAEGADYVILMMHMGVDESSMPFTSYAIAQSTSGVDVILDGHSHSEIPSRIEQNKNGDDVIIAQTGTKLTHIGQLVISADGYISVGYISDYRQKDPDTDARLAAATGEVDALMNKIIAHLDFDMKSYDEKGIRLVRSRETTLGDLVSDSYRAVTGADFAYANGGGIRADLLAGDITYSNVINVSPYGNMVCMTEVSGQEILDMLEYFYEYTQADYAKDGLAVGENGSFGHFSGLKCVVHTDIPSSVVKDGDDMLIGVGETRRVSDVQILKNGAYVPLDPEGTYTMACTDYLLKKGGSGMAILMKDHTALLDEIAPDYQVLADYIISLKNDFSAYRTTGNRVVIQKAAE